jgi:hypothetical protein
MTSSPVSMDIISLEKNRSRNLQTTWVKCPPKTSGKVTMMEQIEMVVMADRNIKKLLPHWHARCSNCPTWFQHFHRPSYNSLLFNTTCTNNLQKQSPSTISFTKGGWNESTQLTYKKSIAQVLFLLGRSNTMFQQ